MRVVVTNAGRRGNRGAGFAGPPPVSAMPLETSGVFLPYRNKMVVLLTIRRG
jgi:hypothetical protein